MSKNDAIILMANSNLKDENGILLLYGIFFTIYKKMAETAYCQKNRDIILNRAKTTITIIKRKSKK